MIDDIEETSMTYGMGMKTKEVRLRVEIKSSA